jgi:hypothetical protein
MQVLGWFLQSPHWFWIEHEMSLFPSALPPLSGMIAATETHASDSNSPLHPVPTVSTLWMDVCSLKLPVSKRTPSIQVGQFWFSEDRAGLCTLLPGSWGPIGPSADTRPPYVCCFGWSDIPGLGDILHSLACLSRTPQLWHLSCPYQGCDTEGCQAILKEQLHCLTSSSLQCAACSAPKFINQKSTWEGMNRMPTPGAHWMTYRCGTVSVQIHGGTTYH